MDYKSAIEYMFTQLPMFHRIGKAAYKANLDNAIALDNYFGKPHRNYPVIHVAGTNGKGSVSHMLAAILQTAGYKTGLFTSPHLKDFRERIRVNGVMISELDVAAFVEKHQKVFDTVKPSFFEMSSAMALEYFNQSKVDIAVIEVGLGGRLDSTNIVTPVISIITNISFDHCELLGNTLEKIAYEKAGIIKPGIPVVIGEEEPETRKVFEAIAQKNNALLYVAEKIYQADYSMFSTSRKQILQVKKNGNIPFLHLELDLVGAYQRKNVCSVCTAIDLLREQGWIITDDHITRAIANVVVMTGLKGRWQEIGHNPLIVCDTGHNISGMQWLIGQIATIPYKNLHMVIGFVNDKDINGIIGLLPENAVYYFTQAAIPRALPVNELYNIAQRHGLAGNCYHSVAEAFDAAKANAGPDDFIFVGGSTFVVSEVL